MSQRHSSIVSNRIAVIMLAPGMSPNAAILGINGINHLISDIASTSKGEDGRWIATVASPDIVSDIAGSIGGNISLMIGSIEQIAPISEIAIIEDGIEIIRRSRIHAIRVASIGDIVIGGRTAA